METWVGLTLVNICKYLHVQISIRYKHWYNPFVFQNVPPWRHVHVCKYSHFWADRYTGTFICNCQYYNKIFVFKKYWPKTWNRRKRRSFKVAISLYINLIFFTYQYDKCLQSIHTNIDNRKNQLCLYMLLHVNKGCSNTHSHLKSK